MESNSWEKWLIAFVYELFINFKSFFYIDIMFWLDDAESVGIEVQRTLDGYLELFEPRKICTVM